MFSLITSEENICYCEKMKTLCTKSRKHLLPLIEQVVVLIKWNNSNQLLSIHTVIVCKQIIVIKK